MPEVVPAGEIPHVAPGRGNRRNYFFVSSPLHLLFSCNLALIHADDDNCVVLVPRASQPFSAFESILTQKSTLFDRVISFETGMKRGKHSERRRRMAVIKEALERQPADRIFTGTDRRIEFQYAMHIGRQHNHNLLGIYLDDGMATYLGHKSSHRLAHRYLDPFFKKLAYGWWWDNPLTIGSSRWIDEIHVAYPALVHESLRGKKSVAINRSIFKHKRFTALCEQVLIDRQVDSQSIQTADAVIVLTHESFYPDATAHLTKLVTAIRQHDETSSIAVKPHPRSEEVDRYQQLFPELVFLDSRVGMELFLPLLSEQCVIIGDISSVLFTTRWFSERTRVLAVMLQTETLGHLEDDLYRLFAKLDIEKVTLEQLADRLRSAPVAGESENSAPRGSSLAT